MSTPAQALEREASTFVDPASSSQQLLEAGYVLVPMPADQAEADRILFAKYLQDIPELLKLPPDSGNLSAGSFGAFAYASSYYCPAAVQADSTASKTLWPVLAHAAGALGLEYIELIPDRLCVRTKPQPKESWHTDQSTGGQRSDVFYGGIYNLNHEQSQVFTLVPGSHANCSTGGGQAFTPVKADKERFALRERTLSIPPGYLLLFNENIVHRVTGGKPKTPIWRKFVAFRLTDSPTQWCPENSERVAQQAALVFKGGREAPMFPKLWLTNWPGKLEAFSAMLRPEMVTKYKYLTGKKAGLEICLPKREPPSLTELHSRYPDADADRFRPKRARIE
jgi:hypothetical protein